MAKEKRENLRYFRKPFWVTPLCSHSLLSALTLCTFSLSALCSRFHQPPPATPPATPSHPRAFNLVLSLCSVSLFPTRAQPAEPADSTVHICRHLLVPSPQNPQPLLVSLSHVSTV
uniref:Uncharacterized protein n=1 Tax=Fagus sylvatica TaxID=28930 RepID=A0A2N9I0F6_FAGSY